MREHLERLAADCDNAHVLFCYSEPDQRDNGEIERFPPSPEANISHWCGRIGVDFLKDILPPSAIQSHHYYICGPPPMMDAVQRDLLGWGVPADAVHLEAFGAKGVGVLRPEEATPDAAPSDAPTPSVTFQRSNKLATWDPSNSRRLSRMPFRWLCLPVRITARLGAQIELVTKALRNSMPSLARRSRFGVVLITEP